MDIDTGKFKSTQIKVMQKELKARQDKINQLNFTIKGGRADSRLIFACWIVTVILYFIK